MQLIANVSEVCRFLLIIVFVVSLIGKLKAFGDFEHTIASILNAPKSSMLSLAAFTILLAEGITAAMLAAGGYFARAGAIIAITILVMFTTVICGVLIQRRRINCNCFGRGRSEITVFDLMRNCVLVIAAGVYLSNMSIAAAIAMPETFLLSGVAFIVFLVSANLREIWLWLSPSALQ